MINYLPPYLRESEVFKELYRVQEEELGTIELVIDDLDAQFNIDTATWALDLYEEELGIKIDKQKPESERRSIIKSRWRGRGRLGVEVIREVINSFTGGGIKIGFDGKILIDFNGTFGKVENPNDMFSAIEDVKPAHLGINSKNSIYCHAEGATYASGGLAYADVFDITDQYNEDFDIDGVAKVGIGQSLGLELSFGELKKLSENNQVITVRE